MANVVRIDGNDVTSFVGNRVQRPVEGQDAQQQGVTPTGTNQVQYQGGGGQVGYSESTASAPYVGQGYGGDLEQTVASDLSDFNQRRREAAAPTTQAQPQTQAAAMRRAEEPRQQAQQIGDNRQAAGLASSGFQRSVTGQSEQEDERPSWTPSQPQVQEGIAPVNFPQETPGVQSSRERDLSLDDAYDTGNPVAEAGIWSSIMRAGDGGVPDDVARSAARKVMSGRTGNSADRAAAMRAAESSENVPSNETAEQPWWMKPLDRVVRFSQNFNLRQNKTVTDARKSQAARAFKREGVGRHIWGKILGYSKLRFDEVGVGLQEITEVIRQNPDMIARLLRPFVTSDMPDVGMMTVGKIVSLINDNEVWVATFKPPNNQGPDIQKRRLRVLTEHQRGIYLHNIMAAMYTADYDGDDMQISLDPDVSPLAKNPMDYMVDMFGKTTLNEDFLPVTKVRPEKGETAESQVKTTMLADFMTDSKGNKVDGRVLDPLVQAIINLGDTEFEPKKQGDAWGKLFMQARKYADKVTNRDRTASDRMMSAICRSVFDVMQRKKYYNALTVSGGDVLRMDEADVPKPRTYGDLVAYKIMDGMIEGSIPNNFQELKLLLTGFAGNVEGKNGAFRFTADVGKMMKMDERLKVGNDYVVDINNDEHISLFFNSTVKHAGSLKMAREIKKAGRNRYYTQVMREAVINEVGFPEKYENFGAFLDKFVSSYKKHSAIINEANRTFLTNMGMSTTDGNVVSSLRTDSNGIVTLGSIAEPFLSIYGTYSVGRMFNVLNSRYMQRSKMDDYWAGNPKARRRERALEREYDSVGDSDFMTREGFWITGKYIDYNLRQFRDENRLMRGEGKKDRRGVTDFQRNVRDCVVSGISSRIGDVNAQFKLLLAIADKRTGAASAYNKATFGEMEGEHKPSETVMMLSKLVTSLKDTLDSSDRDQPLQIEETVSAIIMSDPDLFMYYNMDSPRSFLESNWGQKLMEHADDPEVIGGIYTSMMFDYRMERITDLTQEFLTLTDTERLEETWNDMLLAKDELASSSGVWHGIIRELEAEATPGMKSFFQMMMEKKPVQTAIDGFQYPWTGLDVIKDAQEFWNNPGNHTSLRSVIDDLDLDRKTKWNVITDIVRFWEKDGYLKSYEVGYQMSVGKDASYSLGGAPGESLLKVHREFESSFNRWSKLSQAALRQDVQEAYEKFSKKRGALTSAIRNLDQRPWELVEIDDMMYADSILSVYDKTYAQTEKASQNPWTNAIYSALSIQQNGGYQNDIDRTQDRLLGMTYVDKVTIHDIVHLFANPEEEMMVYGHNGEWGFLSRDILLENELGTLSGNVEQDMWRFFLREPRIAASFRRHSACVMQNSDGKGYLGASASIKATIQTMKDGGEDPIAHTKYLLRDHPGYGAIIALALPGKNLATRNARHRVKQIEDFLSYELYVAASSDWDSAQVAEIILGDLGITQDALETAMRSDYNTYLEKLGLEAFEGDGESDSIADEIYAHAIDWMTDYIDVLKEDSKRKDGGITLGRYVSEPVMPNFSDREIASFHDEKGDPTFLSNMFDTPVTLDGITYRNAEAAFQAQKTLDQNVRMQFANMPGKQARREGKKLELRQDWNSIRTSVMREVIAAKFSNPEMRRLLEETGDARLIEGNTWNDRFWGVSGGSGQNMLGRILMDERRNRWLGPDAVSAAAFWDVVQELSGAKTNVSTGIEGSETYQFANWVSHTRARDGYADLDTIGMNDELTEPYTIYSDQWGEQWAGAWTSLTNDDGSPVFLEVDEEGVSFFMRRNGETQQYFLNPSKDQLSFKDAKDAAEVSEVVVQVPEGYTIKDRSTDTYGTQVASLMAYMVSKRSNGAEAFNLKAKKAGIDGKDSIIKMRGKHKTINGRRVSYFETLLRLRDIAQRNGDNGRRAALMELARMMYEENKDLGYEDLTLANYMSIAELMLIEGDDEKLYLRSIEQLMRAVKYRIGWRVDEMTDEQLFEAVDKIIHDTSENGVGIATMESLDALDNLRPKSVSMGHDAVRQSSSVFVRNYDVLQSIAREAEKNGVIPLSPDEVKELNDESVAFIKKLKNTKSLPRLLNGYNIISMAGFDGHDDRINWSVGPSNVIYIGSGDIDAKRFDEICEQADAYGMTIVCEAANIGKLPSYMRKDAVPLSEYGNDVLIPCFDARLNGSEATPHKGRFEIAQVPFERYVVSVEDSLNEFGLGDAEGQVLKSLTDRMSIHDSGSVKVTAEDLFPNVFKNPKFRDCRFEVGMASGYEVRSLIADGVNCTIDYGVVEGGGGFDQRKRDVDRAIERYRNRWALTNADGILMSMDDCEPGDIVAWAEVKITHPDGSYQCVLAPIIPFPLHGPKRQPSNYSIENIGPVDADGTMFSVDWQNTAELSEQYVKYFDSSGGANKGMISLSSTLDESRRLLDGTEVDMYIAKASTDSRKVGTDRRVKTMISLMALARMHGYNFVRNADGTMNENAFPDNPELREELFRDRIPRDRWKSMFDDNVRFTIDDRLNAFIRYECQKVLDNGGNPSDYLANVYTNEDGEEYNTHVMWEFEAMFDQGLSYEDGLLKFLHFMDPSFCPNGVEDNTNDTLFRLYQEGGQIAQGYDRGVLQMRVPHRLSDNEMAYVWDNVYIGMSFFGEEYSGFSRPNVSGSSTFLDGMNTMSMYGKRLDDRNSRIRSQWSTSDIGRPPHGNGSFEKVVG